MGYGYQKRDYEIIDYKLWHLDNFGRPFRGPKPLSLKKDKFFTCLGGAQTFGCYSEKPFPILLSKKLNIDVLNAGHAGAGPLFFLKRKLHIQFANQSRFVIVQMMSGRSESNSLFESKEGRGQLERRSDRKVLMAKKAYQEFMQTESKENIDKLVAETRENYVRHMIELLQLIKVPKVLLWFSERSPDYPENHTDVLQLFGKYPQFVNRAMLEQIKLYANYYIESISSNGMPQVLISRFTNKEIYHDKQNALGLKKKKTNSYYPSPQMHIHAFKMLSNTCSSIFNQ